MLKDGHISPTQLVAIFFILIIGKEMDSGVLILIHWGHGAAELLLAISELSMAVVIILLFPLFKEPNKNIIDHFYTTFGSFLAPLFSSIFFAALLLDLGMNIKFDIEQIRTVFLPTTPITIVLFICILAMTIPVFYGIEVLSRTNLIMFGMMLTVQLIWDTSSLSKFRADTLPPIFGPGLGMLVKEGILHTGFFGELLTYFMFRPYVRSYSSFKRSFYVVVLATLLLGVIRLLLLQSAFPYPTDDHLFFPFIELARLLYFGRYIQHVEAVYAVIWLAVALARLSIMMYLLALMTAAIGRTHNYRRFVTSIASLVYYGALLPFTLSDAIDFKDVVLEKRLSFVYIGVVFLFLMISYFKLWREKHAPNPANSKLRTLKLDKKEPP